ncbi:hypothetical protein Rrhod_0442 [Rhodococcus rhodnii LMG 5362]|uniref:UDP-glucose 4-epimerase n=1 Tax=Rhodococcus rhodnii LMG 5362 TaxID=1273125 RepID=R7WSB3_9NOCA|nr:hypothetical protein Rrhod_0442 [Rhodococcus rhodnii LMG 5362]
MTGTPLATRETDPRPGDNAGAFSHGDRAAELLDWRPRHTIEDGIRDSLTWFATRDTILDPDTGA